MTKISTVTINALRNTALKLEKGNDHMWGHMGSCNCGNLAQEVTRLTKAQIHAYAMQGRGDWNEQLNDYCETSGLPMDLLIFELLTVGFSLEDLKHLEYLSKKEILDRLPKNTNLVRNRRADVIVYMKEWAAMLEEKMIASIQLPNFFTKSEAIKPLVNA